MHAALIFAAISLALLAPALHGVAAHSCRIALERPATGELSGAGALGAAPQGFCAICLSASQARGELAAPAIALPTASGSTQWPITPHCAVALVPPARPPAAPRAPPGLRICT
jgi:hypothetical protein